VADEYMELPNFITVNVFYFHYLHHRIYQTVINCENHDAINALYVYEEPPEGDGLCASRTVRDIWKHNTRLLHRTLFEMLRDKLKI